ncbi:MAG TPA: formate--tetrahydrofolate ligase, partial [Armatimonadota bacterium]|nr:formate--tetrahydrofolate ligase [Armatimonadota bacterium]
RKFGIPIVAAINRRNTDTAAELAALARLCEAEHLPVALADPWGSGGAGCEDLGRALLQALDHPAHFRTLYPDDVPLRDKLERVAREIYRAGHVELLPAAAKRLHYLEARGFGELPICVAKTQYSFSDDPTRLGAPEGYTFTVRDFKLSAGAGFVVAYAGTLLTMPGLPRRPTACDIDLLPDSTVTGLF